MLGLISSDCQLFVFLCFASQWQGSCYNASSLCSGLCNPTVVVQQERGQFPMVCAPPYLRTFLDTTSMEMYQFLSFGI